MPTKTLQPLSLQVDMVFKAVFGQDKEESKIILTDLLNTILNRNESDKIISLTHKNPINDQLTPDDKESIMDIKVETNNGELIDIEMQVSYESYFPKRSLYYWARLHSTQLSEGQHFDSIKKSICINIMANRCFKDLHDDHLLFQPICQNHNRLLCSDMEIHYVQLPFIDDTMEVDTMNRFTEWMTLIKDIHLAEKKKLISRITTKDGVMKMAYDEYSRINEDELKREKLEARQKFLWDINSAKAHAVKAGRVEGRVEGKTEARTEMALKMLGKGMDLETISELTDLTIEELNNLANQPPT